VAYFVSLTADETASTVGQLRIDQRLTVALRRGQQPVGVDSAGPPVVLVLTESGVGGPRRLQFLGVRARHNIVGPVDRSITIEPLRECMQTIYWEGPVGNLLDRLPKGLASDADRDAPRGAVGECDRDVWSAVEGLLREGHPELGPLLDWLLAQANQVVFDDSPADQSWQEQQDATRTVVRIAGFPPSAVAAWDRPPGRDDPYLAGVIPQPPEHSLIEHDIRAAGVAFDMAAQLANEPGARCHIHVLRDNEGRQLEIANVNAIGVEHRTGTDMLYYYQPTESFVLVQYKRIDPVKRFTLVDARLRSQLTRLEKVASLSRSAQGPDDWRLAGDPCFLKLAYWPQSDSGLQVDGLAPGMYLPVSYVRLLLEDACTGDDEQRHLGYPQVARHIVNTQFIELVRNGLAGTVGVTRDQLLDLVIERTAAGSSMVVAIESSRESAKARHQRAHSRKRNTKPYTQLTFAQPTLFDGEVTG
jgi:hypothetical protein